MERERQVIQTLSQAGKGVSINRFLKHLTRKRPADTHLRDLWHHLATQLPSHTTPLPTTYKREIWVCRACQATWAIPTGQTLTRCTFCGESAWATLDTADGIDGIQRVIPAWLTADQCHELLLDWLQSSWLLPPHITLNRDHFQHTFLPFWSITANLRAVWTSPKAQGEVMGRVENLLHPASAHLSNGLLGQGADYQWSEAQPYDNEAVRGMTLHLPDAPRETVLLPVRQKFRAVMETQQPFLKQPQVSETITEWDDTWELVLLPAYLGTYTYGSSLYQVVVNGQTGQVRGQRPVNYFKIWWLCVGAVTPGFIFTVMAAAVLDRIGLFILLPLLMLLAGLLLVGLILQEAFGYQNL